MPNERVWEMLATVEPGLRALATRGGKGSGLATEYLKGRRNPGGEIRLADFPPEEALFELKVGSWVGVGGCSNGWLVVG